jgi:hypothetical protein
MLVWVTAGPETLADMGRELLLMGERPVWAACTSCVWAMMMC